MIIRTTQWHGSRGVVQVGVNLLDDQWEPHVGGFSPVGPFERWEEVQAKLIQHMIDVAPLTLTQRSLF